MSDDRADKEKELRKLEYLERRGVATSGDALRRKRLAREIAVEDFEEQERVGEEARRRAEIRPGEATTREQQPRKDSN